MVFAGPYSKGDSKTLQPFFRAVIDNVEPTPRRPGPTVINLMPVGMGLSVKA